MLKELNAKKEYFQIVKDVLEENQSDTQPRDAIEFIYAQYEECEEVYRNSKRQMYFTKKSFVETFAKLYPILGEEVFALKLHVFVKCVSCYLDGEVLTEEMIEDFKTERVWNVFAYHC